MGLNETSPMNADDSLACQSIEVFEASSTEASDADLRSQFPTLAAGHIGIRCSHCASNPTSTKDATIFPANIESMADGVRTLSERHLGDCAMAPASTREMNQQAAEKRSRNDRERGSSWQDDERSRMALREWCHRFCQRQGIVDKGPSGAGLVFMQHVGPMYGHQDPGILTRVGRPGTMGVDPLTDMPVSRRRERPSMPGDYRASMGGYEAFGQGSEGYYAAPDSMATHSSEGHEGAQGMTAGQQHPASPPHRGYQQQQMAPLDAHDNFPFFQEANGCWTCKYCCHVPPPYRQPQSMWGAPNHMPPPPQYMDQHLSMCRAYHQSISSQQMFQGSTSQGQFPFMAQDFAGAQQGGWEGSGPGSQSSQGQSMSYHPQSNLETPSGTQSHLAPHSPYPQTPHQMTGAASASSHRRMPQPRTPASLARRPDSSDAAVQHAIDFLTAADRDAPYAPGIHNTEGNQYG